MTRALSDTAVLSCAAATVMATKRILIIDDEVDVRAVIQGCLEDVGGWDVVTAESAKDGLAKVIMDAPDAIMLDVMMPGIDGLAFLAILRNYVKETQIPVVLLTAKISVIESAELSGLNVKGIIAKPFDPFFLVEQFANFLNWQVEV